LRAKTTSAAALSDSRTISASVARSASLGARPARRRRRSSAINSIALLRLAER
jgi:hypothetical protein